MHFAKLQKCITEATEKQDVYKLFDVLQGTATLDSVQHIDTHLTEDRKRLSTSKWQGAKHWVHDKHPNFKVGETLKGVIMDWSDAVAKGLYN